MRVCARGNIEETQIEPPYAKHNVEYGRITIDTIKPKVEKNHLNKFERKGYGR